MAVLSGGILGTVSGKVAGVVAAQWKDKNYVRQYNIPANPNTAEQQYQRGLFGNCVAYAKLILGQVLNSFVDPFQKSMSGFNYFIKRNIDTFETAAPTNAVICTFGKLYMGVLGEPTGSTNHIRETFAVDAGANGRADDKVFAMAWEEETGKVYFNTTGVLRSTGTIDITLPAGQTTFTGRVWLWAGQYLRVDGETDYTKLLLVSDSLNCSCSIT